METIATSLEIFFIIVALIGSFWAIKTLGKPWSIKTYDSDCRKLRKDKK